MTLFMPIKGTALLVPSGPGDYKHLFFLLTDPGSDKKNLIVNMTTYRQNVFVDNTCILNPGDHDFIKGQSFVEYRLAEIKDSQSIIDAVNNEEFIYKPPPSPAILKNICDGVCVSPFTPQKIKNYYLAKLA